MFQGNWKCSGCGGEIKELPFEPRSEAGLTCRDCYMKQKGGGSSTPPETDSAGPQDTVSDDAQPATEAPMGQPQADGGQAQSSERPKFSGDWKCADCNGPITSLPFEPSNTSNLKCIDCFKKGKG